MKSQPCDAACSTTPVRSASILTGIRHDAGSRIGKTRPARDSAITEEMQFYFSKLKEIVPFMPKNKKLSKLEIIQHVIDYICDLQTALETHPAASRSTVPSPSSPSRQPLGVITAPNALPNSCGAQEVCQHDKTSPHLDDVSTRPVSC